MTKKKASRGGKSLVIVESPAKARTISKFLGKDFVVEASIGHVRDLPEGAKQIPAKYKGEDWAYLGVNVNEQFAPVYIVPPAKTEQVRKLKALVKDAKDLYLATDEDREGEAISWHLREVLKPNVPVRRLVFHEITEEAIRESLANPRDIDDDLVRAQETRRIVDRLYGYEVSPLLWRKVRPRLSAGRVQSVAVRLIVERERLRMAFASATYWDLLAAFAKSSGEDFRAVLVSVDDRKIPTSKDFDTSTGNLKNPELLQLDEDGVGELAARLKTADFRVASIEHKPFTSKPYPPFTTSTLQQEANRKLRFSASRTMKAAQGLYENGHITYMRTDSTNLAKVAVEAARELVGSQYGPEYLPEKPRIYKTKVKNAQEAHEAIRPAGHPFALPDTLRSELTDDQFKLYDMIWKRTVASQMSDARGHRIAVAISGGGAKFHVSGKTIDFPGYLRAYVEGADDPDAELADKETLLPQLEVDEKLLCNLLEPKSHTTKPAARFTEATLTRALEELGIGRPSTYASIIETIQARSYVNKKSNALVPTWLAMSVAKLLESHLPNLVDYSFTAKMEDDLDAISRGEGSHVDYLHAFYFGDDKIGLKQQLKNKVEEIDARDINRMSLGCPPGDGPNTEEVAVRVGKYGPFLEQGERRTSIPDDLAPDEMTLAKAIELLDRAQEGDTPLGMCPDTGKPVFLKVGRFGPYVQRGTTDDDEKPKNASLLKGMTPEEVDLPLALKLLLLPRELGPHPENAQMVVAHNGRFGPYVKCGDETRSLPQDLSPLDVDMAKAMELLAQPKKARGFGAKKEPLKVFAESPVTKEPVSLLDGRYGPYVTDGTTNASLPKGASTEELTFERALDLLAERAAKGPPKKRAKKKSAKKKATKKATKKKPKTKKRAATKATAKKSAAKKTPAT